MIQVKLKLLVEVISVGLTIKENKFIVYSLATLIASLKKKTFL